MRITIRLFARLREIVGAAEIARTVDPGATVGSLWQQLAREHAGLGEYERSISCAVNADYARMNRELADGDEVAFLPPVSGGQETPTDQPAARPPRRASRRTSATGRAEAGTISRSERCSTS